jgi:ABC-type multidrug transport system fused ATPase/permease subunit
MFFPIVEIFSALAIGLTLWYGGGLILEHALMPGVIIAFIQYIQRIYNPIRDIAEKYNIMQAAMASSERIFTLLDTEETIKNPELPEHPQEKW